MLPKSSFLSVLVMVASCVAPADEAPSASPPSPERPRATSPVQGEAPKVDAPADAPPAEKFSQGERAFAAAKEALLKRYLKEGLTEDDAYRAATMGLLEHLDPDKAMKPWNKLLSPSELSAMRGDLRGEIVGIGVEIRFDSETGYSDVVSVIPKSAAERAGLARGDKIISVDGRFFRGATEAEVAGHIRGKAGEPVKLVVLHEDKLSTLDIPRERVVLETVTHFMLEGRVGYLRIRGFAVSTGDATRAALTELERADARALVLDLRQNQGGSFDEALMTAGYFLPKGTPIVTTKKRDKREETFTSKGDPVLANVPLAVLCDGGTSSGAELFAAALQESRHAALLGARTFGKWSVQTLDELENGYALKYTIAVFKTPSGRTFDGTGITPDIEVDMSEKQVARAMGVVEPEARLAVDTQLRTAAAYLRRP